MAQNTSGRRRFSPLPLLKAFRNCSMTTKLMITLIPSIVAILLATGVINYMLSQNFIDIALERTVSLRNLALAHEMESYLESCKQDLLFVAQSPKNSPPDAESMRSFLQRKNRSGGRNYCEFAYLSPDGESHIFLVAHKGKVHRIPAEQLGSIRPNPMVFVQDKHSLSPGRVLPSHILQVEYPFPTAHNRNNRVESQIIRFVTPYAMPGASHPGYLMLGINVTDLRHLLSLHNSPQSPVWAHPRSNEVRFFFMVDTDGWILFQSEDVGNHDQELTTYQARSGYDGTLGKPGLPSAFRPDPMYKPYWHMIDAIRKNTYGIEHIGKNTDFSRNAKEFFFAYAPLTFTPGAAQGEDAESIVIGGICFVDRSQLNVAAGYRFLDVMLIITLVATVLVSLLIFGLSHVITGPLLRLSKAVTTIRSTGRVEPIGLPDNGYEMSLLKNAINSMILKVKRQMEEIRRKDETIHNVNLQEKASLEDEIDATLLDTSGNRIPEFMGTGPLVATLKSDIIKAAQVDVDVLVMGETGTGKQLAADAIHSHSKRSAKPFIAINCGALDENLLLDALFGHIKGAFTEARTDRKGAFVEAHGGTLFLDEIQSASPKVQQALLRAIAMRKVQPLGSDKEVDVNVRLIAATNADLKELIAKGEFREDLYFRLKVVTVRTPPLREHRESIPILSMHFLRQAEPIADKKGLALSKGALEKLRNYGWPGNIRELLNTITRAVVMSESDIIQAREILLESEDSSSSAEHSSHKTSVRHEPDAPEHTSSSGRDSGVAEEFQESQEQPEPDRRGSSHAAPDAATTDSDTDDRASASPLVPAADRAGITLSDRQQKAYPYILRQGEISRGKYQKLVGGDLPSRTAIYDLQDMVKKGLLQKTGKGPATKYVLVAHLKHPPKTS